MAFSVYVAMIPSCRQVLEAGGGVCSDILRWKGLPLGKRDFIGRLRVKS